MLFVAPIAALAGASAQPTVQQIGLRPAGAVAQATVTVRIVSGTAIRFDQEGHFQTDSQNRNAQPAYRSTVTLDGTQVPAAIAEFE